MKKILIVDDDAELRTSLVDLLKGFGYQVEAAATAKDALAKIETQDFDIVLLDFMMPKMTGAEALATIKKLRPRCSVIMLTAFATIENAVDAMKKGASDYIAKPFKIPDLLTTIRRVLEEAKFEACATNLEFDHALTSLANPIRRSIITLLHSREKMRLMEITRELKIEDHTKVIFHLKILKEAGIIEQDDEKTYSLAAEGKKALACLKTLEDHLRSS
jgi:CheY-like chemotaxis protein